MDVAALFRRESRRTIAGLARRLGDLDQAEDAVADAFVLALERWPRDGVPSNPASWIATVARNRAVDRIRRERSGIAKIERLARLEAVASPHANDADDTLGDDRLELLFACIHPALDRDAQVALTLRALGGLTTDEIADAFMVGRSTMQQRLVRAKKKIALPAYRSRCRRPPNSTIGSMPSHRCSISSLRPGTPRAGPSSRAPISANRRSVFARSSCV